jgi:hypothetical protein
MFCVVTSKGVDAIAVAYCCRPRDIMNNHDPQNYIASPAISAGISDKNILILEKLHNQGLF